MKINYALHADVLYVVFRRAAGAAGREQLHFAHSRTRIATRR